VLLPAAIWQCANDRVIVASIGGVDSLSFTGMQPIIAIIWYEEMGRTV